MRKINRPQPRHRNPLTEAQRDAMAARSAKQVARRRAKYDRLAALIRAEDQKGWVEPSPYRSET